MVYQGLKSIIGGTLLSLDKPKYLSKVNYDVTDEFPDKPLDTIDGHINARIVITGPIADQGLLNVTPNSIRALYRVTSVANTSSVSGGMNDFFVSMVRRRYSKKGLIVKSVIGPTFDDGTDAYLSFFDLQTEMLIKEGCLEEFLYT